MRRTSSTAATRATELHRLLLVPFGLAPMSSLDVLQDFDHEDWDELLRVADVHRVLPALGASPIADRAPPNARARLEASYFTGLTFHLEAVETLGQLVVLFGSADIRWAAIKGPVLAETVYPRVDQRWYSDVDVLVHPRDFGRAVALLEREGGRVAERNWSLMTAEERGELTIAFPTAPTVDIHWHLLFDHHVRRRFRFPTSALLARTSEVALGRTMVPVLDPVDQLVHLFLHSCLSGGHLLRWSLDLWFSSLRLEAEYSAARPRQLAEALRDVGAEVVAAVMTARAERLVGRPLLSAAHLSDARDSWAAAQRLIDRLHPPEQWMGGSGSGRLLIGSTRSSAASSAAALGGALLTTARELTTNADHPWRRTRRAQPFTTPAVLHEDPTEGARRGYFDRVAASAR